MADKSLISTFLFSCVLVFRFWASTQAQTSCSTQTFSNQLQYQICTDLPVLGCSIHWTQNDDGTTSVAYSCSGISTSSPKWVAWGPNFKGQVMAGTQALIGYVNSSGGVQARTSNVSGYSTTLAAGNLDFPVTNVSAELSGSRLNVFATLRLPSTSGMWQLWQVGDMSGSTFRAHPTSGDNVKSVSTLDLNSGTTTSAGGVPRIHRKNVHGVLNAVSWGTLMPLGAMIARYLKVSREADPAWFYLHVACQSSAYVIGVAGWGTGLKLGSDSKGITYDSHRNIGITLFCLGTLQVFALLLRPKKDNKYRLYWNIYHHSVGYTVIILSVINIYKGFDILDPEKKWKRAYTGIIIALGAVAVLLEAFTWAVVLRRKKKEGSEKSHHGANGVTGL